MGICPPSSATATLNTLDAVVPGIHFSPRGFENNYIVISFEQFINQHVCVPLQGLQTSSCCICLWFLFQKSTLLTRNNKESLVKYYNVSTLN
jgi:hypothetical protein